MTGFRAVLALGGNVGDVKGAMRSALTAIDAREDLCVAKVSKLYATPPWGKTDQPDFINACALVETVLEPLPLLDLCLHIERLHGRERGERWGPRTLDLDVIDYDGRTIRDERLELPHPRAADRAFVLRPLADLDGTLLLGGASVSARLAGLSDDGIKAISQDGSWWRE
ncbi:2-amino-4-hydroxy-6-hydroxymethyldihydropteridine diphosphokinase [Fulvimarina sp. 2208YS6-2-32]|uniref:2-amino-4-hydroxy-6-hydroxymethyldihydropteridine pyrophosphokinase n=1 Tax=Fulvimarina uroteuthidis TaxID=3098149 RepID=A0ABU5I4H1_9HYPH|nr:2-amino-4-hydroxy-6-hydroxymethyldihydropteridine diphosphokinase [Fulvimarina sp. 2208YS6-2-32]MDY8110295.1 2-amino-4-hydroxy-6-hydroxymethyldihydropteridine diphosphokinase [Fulvimarina sp. 2208YS6-2-32]